MAYFNPYLRGVKPVTMNAGRWRRFPLGNRRSKRNSAISSTSLKPMRFKDTVTAISPQTAPGAALGASQTLTSVISTDPKASRNSGKIIGDI